MKSPTRKVMRRPVLTGKGGRLNRVKMRNWETRDNPDRNRDGKKSK